MLPMHDAAGTWSGPLPCTPPIGHMQLVLACICSSARHLSLTLCLSSASNLFRSTSCFFLGYELHTDSALNLTARGLNDAPPLALLPPPPALACALKAGSNGVDFGSGAAARIVRLLLRSVAPGPFAQYPKILAPRLRFATEHEPPQFNPRIIRRPLCAWCRFPPLLLLLLFFFFFFVCGLVSNSNSGRPAFGHHTFYDTPYRDQHWKAASPVMVENPTRV
jgi:hypothetical protein